MATVCCFQHSIHLNIIVLMMEFYPEWPLSERLQECLDTSSTRESRFRQEVVTISMVKMLGKERQERMKAGESQIA